jgi:hypothetical protein
MPYAAHQEDAKPFQVMPGGKAVKDLDVTVIAGGATEVKDPERFPETIILEPHGFCFYNPNAISTIATTTIRFIQMKKKLDACFIFTLGLVFFMRTRSSTTPRILRTAQIILIPGFMPLIRSAIRKAGRIKSIMYFASLIIA